MRRPRLRTIVRAALLLIVLLTVTIAVLLRTGRVHEWLRAQAVMRLNAILDGEVAIGQLSGSLLHDVTVRNFRIVQHGDTVIEAASVSASYDALQLLRGHLVFTDVRVERPYVHLVQTATGWNVAHLTKPTGKPSAGPVAIALERVRIDDGRVALDLNGRPRIDLDRLDADTRVDIGAKGVDVAIARGSVRDAASGQTISELTGGVGIAEAVTFRDMHVIAPGLDARFDGARASGRIDGLDATAQLQDWHGGPVMTFVPALAEIPVLTGTVAARGASDALATSWALTVPNGGGRSTGRMQLDVTRASLPIRGAITCDACNLAVLARQPDLKSRITGDATIDGVIDADDVTRSSARFTFKGRSIAIAGYAADRITASGQLRERGIQASGEAHAYDADATFDLRTRIPVKGEPVPIESTGTVSHLNALKLPMAADKGLETDVSGAYTFAYDGAAWQAQLTADDSTVREIAVAPGTIVRAAGREKRLEASIDGTVQHVTGELLGVPASTPLTLGGRIAGRVVIPNVDSPGDLAAIEGDLRGHLEGEAGPDQTSATADVDASIANGLVDVRQLDVTSALASITAHGHLAVPSDAPAATDSALDYVIDASDLSALAAVGLADLRGAVHAEGTVTGPPDEWRVHADLGGHQLAYGDRAKALTINGTIDGRVPVGKWQDAAATIVLDGTFMNVGDYEIQRAALTTKYARQQIEIGGRVDQQARSIEFDSSILLRPEYRELHLRSFALNAQGEPWRLAPGREAVVRYGGGNIRITDLTLERGQERLDAQGLVALDPSAGTASGDLTATVTSLNVGDLFTLATGTPRVQGTADGRLHLTGDMKNPTAEVEMRVANGQVADVPFADVQATARLANKVADVTAHLVEPRGATFDVSGRVPTAADAGPADLRVTSPGISLALVQGMTTAVSDVAGIAALDVRLTGPLADLDIGGNVHLSDAALRVTSTGSLYQHINADVRFENGWATFDRASLQDDDGHTLNVTGRLGLHDTGGSRQVEAAITSDSIHVLENGLGDVEVSADLQITGSLAAPRVSGHVEATRARIEVDELLRAIGSSASPLPPVPPPSSSAARALTPAGAESVGEPKATAVATGTAAVNGAPSANGVSAPGATVAPGAPASASNGASQSGARAQNGAEAADDSVWSRATVNVDVRMPDNLVLRGRNLRVGTGSMGLGDINLTVGGTMTLRKPPRQDPILVGAVAAVRGFYEFQGRRFTVTRGSTVQFRGTRPINPSLDVTGEREVSGITARVRVTGTARRPAIALSSQPPLEEGDVLALIVFNQPLNELGSSQQVDLLQRAGDMALGAVASRLTESIGRTLDLDLFEVRAPTAEGAGEVSVGTQVNERVFVGFKQQFGSAEASRVSIEYRLTEAIRLLTSFGQGGNSNMSIREREAAGVDLVYTIRY
jgi:autotransporter translocation and assembly factor TamB